ncbi:hypothetical protein CIW48_24430 [Methylobacterium sp. P1-11]|uniref:hypothetical protein n=1 Tax=Methylobacterium sp. P1-11 TaxID=2024616 RepID=UPI0011EF0EFD|nr:hypothetical protein [Methylobacterium sp. P1-11]KAA0121367.1 hypothetical protein CIW48_24430 [Methylobacterium sp. P1-11]
MKRRSARPFMVEVKQTRSARTSLTATTARQRPDKSLWPELAQAAMEPPAPAPQAAPAPRPERKAPDAPVRRVLPSLVPMFEIPAEPATEAATEAVTAPAAETAPRVRRVRSARVAAAGQDLAPRVQTAKPHQAAQPTPPVDEAPPACAAPAASGRGPSSRPTAGRRANELRLGERWKRRLPHFLR